MSDDLLLRVEGNRAVLTGKPGGALLQLSLRLEGSKRWLKTGAFSFEATPGNLDRFRVAFPACPIEAPKIAPDWAEKGLGDGLGLSRGVFSPRTAPYPFQARGLALSARPRAFALLGEMGTGKSKILIDTAGTLWCAGEIDAVLIVALKGVHEQWVEDEENQFLTHCGVPWHGAAVTRAKKLPVWSPDKLAVLSVNFNYILSKAGFDNCWNFIQQFRNRVLIIIDESHEIKNMSAKLTDACTALGGRCNYRRIATGTPIGKNLLDALSQYNFLDERILGHRYKTSFQAEYCIMGGYHMNDVIAHKNVEQFWEKVEDYTFRITKEEADLGLPPKVYDRVDFELSDEQRHHYNALKEDMLTQLDNGKLLTVSNSIALLIRLQQVTCGFLVQPGDKENGIPDKVQYLQNARIEALDRVISERDGKKIIWARFNEDITAIARHLGKGCVTYYGATSPRDREDAKRRFLDPDDPVVLVANPAAGGTGLNLQGHCRTVIYYSNSFDAIARWQSEDRVHRIGMKFPVTYFDLVARKTIDIKVLANLRNKKSLADLALDDIRRIVS